MRRMKCALAVAAACGGALFVVVGSQAASASSPGRATLAGTAAPSAARTHHVGLVNKPSAVNFEVVLKLRDAGGAQALVQSISTPGSAELPALPDGGSVGSSLLADRHAGQTRSRLAQKRGLLGRCRVEGPDSRSRRRALPRRWSRRSAPASRTTRSAARPCGWRPATSPCRARSSGVVEGAMGVNQNVATAQDVGDPDIAGSALPQAGRLPSRASSRPRRRRSSPLRRAARTTVPVDRR